MTRLITLLTIIAFSFAGTLSATSNTFMDYQNYNHGYCPECQCKPCQCGKCADPVQTDNKGNPYVQPQQNPECNNCEKPDPCSPAPTCGTKCGFSNCTLGIIVATVCAAAAIIVSGGFSHS